MNTPLDNESLPVWINNALINELELIRATQDVHVQLVESLIYSPDCKLVWEKSEALTYADSDGQVWLMYAILKALSAIDEDMTEAEKWRESTISAANKLRNKLLKRPKERYVNESERMAAKINELIEGLKVNFKTTKFATRPSKATYSDKEHFVKQLILEYLKRGGAAHEADVQQITNTVVKVAGLFEQRPISMTSVCDMAKTVKAKYHELTAEAVKVLDSA